jgi:hypothetical protein
MKITFVGAAVIAAWLLVVIYLLKTKPWKETPPPYDSRLGPN